jgi:hypothetical protein
MLDLETISNVLPLYNIDLVAVQEVRYAAGGSHKTDRQKGIKSAVKRKVSFSDRM